LGSKDTRRRVNDRRREAYDEGAYTGLHHQRMMKDGDLANMWLLQGPQPSRGRHGCMNEQCAHGIIKSTKDTLGLAVLG